MDNLNASTTKFEVMIQKYESQNKISFKPNRAFYDDLAIGQKRFWQIIEGKASPTLCELKSICEHFKVDPKDFV